VPSGGGVLETAGTPTARHPFPEYCIDKTHPIALHRKGRKINHSRPPLPARMPLAALPLVVLAALCAAPLCAGCGHHLLRVQSRPEERSTPTAPTTPQPQSQPQALLPQQSRPEPTSKSPTRTAPIPEAGLTLIPFLAFLLAQVVQKGTANK